jgi:hypothetical protein
MATTSTMTSGTQMRLAKRNIYRCSVPMSD